MTATFTIDSFIRDADAFARMVSADELFSFRARRIDVPPSCIALAWGESTQPSLIPAGRPMEAAGVREVLLVKSLPVPLDFEIVPLQSRDCYEFSAAVWLAVQAVPERTELEQLRRAVVGSRNRADTSDLQRHCEESVREALARFARLCDAAELILPETWAAFDGLLAEQFQPVGFASGLALGSEIRVTFDSPAYSERQRDDASRARRAKQTADEAQIRTAAAEARRQHLEELSGLLDRIKTTAEKTPGGSVSDVIRTFDVTRRGELYGGLMTLGARARRTQCIVVVAGEELLWFDPICADKPIRRVAVPITLGPLRSVRLGLIDARPMLLVGARQGVFLMDATGGDARLYVFEPRGPLRGGVNAAAILGSSLYATHSEAGLVRWQLDAPQAAEFCLGDLTKTAKAVRDVQTDAVGRIWLTVDSRIIAWRSETKEAPTVFAAPAGVQSFVVADNFIFAGLDSGAIVRWPTTAPLEMEELRPSGGDAVHSLDWLSGGGIPRLLIADKRPHLTLQVLGDTYHAEYRWKQPLRWGFAAEDCIVGVNDLRDQLVLWRSDTPEQPAATISVARLCGHSVQDVALVASDSASRAPVNA